MNELRIELVGGRRRVGLSIVMAAALSGVWELHIQDFENELYFPTPDEIKRLRVLYADMNAALEECQQLPNFFDARDLEFFISRYRQRREARERQRKHADEYCIDAFSRPDPAKIAAREAEAAAETTRLMIEKTKKPVADAKFAMDQLAGPKKNK